MQAYLEVILSKLVLKIDDDNDDDDVDDSDNDDDNNDEKQVKFSLLVHTG